MFRYSIRRSFIAGASGRAPAAMGEHMKVAIAIVVGILALAIVLPLLGLLFKMLLGLFHLAMFAVWLAFLVAMVVFVIGLARRLLRV
jgi:hypothetical protein